MNRRCATRPSKGAIAPLVGVAAVTALALALLGEGNAQANPMDLAPERLSGCAVPADCGVIFNSAGAPITNPNYLRADNAAWAKLMSQYGMAIAPTAMHPAKTTGYAGFEMSLFGVVTSVSKDEDFMRRGTEGAIADGKYPQANGTPDSVLQLYGVSGRKGLPYGFEIQGSVGYMANTELVALGGGIRWSIFEGFRRGFPGAIPDLSVGGYVNTLTGSAKVKLTVPALDVQISKPFAIANQLVIQPYLGWQMLWLLADSSVVDLTPANDGLSKCNARPPSAAERAAGDNGEFHCQEKGVAGITGDAAKGSVTEAQKLDLNQNAVFQNIRYRRQRLMVGVAFRYEIAQIILHFATDLADPEAGVGADSGSYCPSGSPAGSVCKDTRINGLAKQWTLGMSTGVSW
jgi:hypothetical protein